MPYDDPILRELGGYFKAEEPGRRERDNAWYFCNALVRANYADYAREVSRDWSYLEKFFHNLLLGEQNEMKSRYLLIGLTEEDKQKIRELTEENGGRETGGQKKKVARKSGQKNREKNGPQGREKSREKKQPQSREKNQPRSREKILALLEAKPTLTYAGLAEAVGLTVKAIEKNVRQLKALGRLRRVGPDKGGHWEVI